MIVQACPVLQTAAVSLPLNLLVASGFALIDRTSGVFAPVTRPGYEISSWLSARFSVPSTVADVVLRHTVTRSQSLDLPDLASVELDMDSSTSVLADVDCVCRLESLAVSLLG